MSKPYRCSFRVKSFNLTEVEAIPGVKHAEVEVVFDPVWDRTMMSDAAKLQLGMMW